MWRFVGAGSPMAPGMTKVTQLAVARRGRGGAPWLAIERRGRGTVPWLAIARREHDGASSSKDAI